MNYLLFLEFFPVSLFLRNNIYIYDSITKETWNIRITILSYLSRALLVLRNYFEDTVRLKVAREHV